MPLIQIELKSSILQVAPEEWGSLERGESFYQSHSWLLWAEEDPAVRPVYVLAREPGGLILGAVSAYVWSGALDSRSCWYDPLRLFVAPGASADKRRPAWFPLLLIGSRAGYHSDLFTAAGLDGATREAVARALLRTCHELAREAGAQSMALMYASEETARLAHRCARGATSPIPTSAEAVIPAGPHDFGGYLSRFRRKRRNTIVREIEAFRAGGSTVREARLADCCDQVGPLMAELQRKYGHADGDAEMTAHLKSQASAMNDISRVFLEVRDGEVVGFVLCYQWERTLQVRAAGFNYRASAPFAYFNLAYYQPMRYALDHGLHAINLGVGAYQVKVSRGARLEPLWSVVWPPQDGNAEWFRAACRPPEEAIEARLLGAFSPSAFPDAAQPGGSGQ
ncbi:GNAT family N-acetyltransferase [Streptomyces sp. NPDC005728]|uniref:GNAT family N-acetyltransferase n=1 Tax=Streptomyces sp. NPDC005728 TaxID=3157054 RepID=UPI0033EEFCC0